MQRDALGRAVTAMVAARSHAGPERFFRYDQYEGKIASFLPLLLLGQWTHIGEAAVWGHGQFQVRSIDGDPTPVRLFVMPRSQADSAWRHEVTVRRPSLPGSPIPEKPARRDDN